LATDERVGAIVAFSGKIRVATKNRKRRFRKVKSFQCYLTNAREIPSSLSFPAASFPFRFPSFWKEEAFHLSAMPPRHFPTKWRYALEDPDVRKGSYRTFYFSERKFDIDSFVRLSI
jgi:hypothetical protein